MFSQPSYQPFAATYPWRVFALVMLTVFSVEGAIMLAMPVLPAWTQARVCSGVFDATMLTLATAPVVWWLAVAPVRRLFEARGELLRRLFRYQEEERQRIARDLHDEIGQHLTALLVGLKTMESIPDLSTARARAGDLRDLAAMAHDEVRRLARGLRPGVLEELGLEAAMGRLCEDFERTHGTAVRLDLASAALAGLSPAAELSLYRILQEALTNVARHADSADVEVVLHQSDGWITLSIADRGCGIPEGRADSVRDGSTLGLAGIRERALMLGGTCSIRSHEGRGTVVQVSIPAAGNRDG